MPPFENMPTGSAPGIGTHYIKHVYLRSTMTPAMTTMTANATPTTPPVPRPPVDGATLLDALDCADVVVVGVGAAVVVVVVVVVVAVVVVVVVVVEVAA